MSNLVLNINFFRNLLATIAGLFIGGCVNMLLVTVGPHVVPPPAGVDMSDVKSMAESIHLLDARHFVFPFLAHALGTLVGSAVAYLLATGKRIAYSYVVGVLFLTGGIAASTMIPAPKWFISLDLVVAYLPMAWLGGTIARRISGRIKSDPPLK